MNNLKLKTKIPSIKGYNIQKKMKKDIYYKDKINNINPIYVETRDYVYKQFELDINLEGFTSNKIVLSNSRAYMIKKNNGNHKLVVYQIHGGAYALPISDNNSKSAVLYSKYIDNSDVFCLDYRVSSQAVFPAALDDALEGYMYLLNNGYNPNNIIVAGHSAGAGLSIALAMLLRDKGIELPRCLCLASPWADLAQKGISYTKNRNKDVLFGSSRKEAVNEIALPTDYSNELTNPYVSPIYGSFSNLPPILIQCGSYEMLLSDSIEIEKKIKQANGNITLNIYKAMWHDFYTKRDDFKEARIAWKEISKFVKRA